MKPISFIGPCSIGSIIVLVNRESVGLGIRGYKRPEFYSNWGSHFVTGLFSRSKGI